MTDDISSTIAINTLRPLLTAWIQWMNDMFIDMSIIPDVWSLWFD